jgi:hypothetical protein
VPYRRCRSRARLSANSAAAPKDSRSTARRWCWGQRDCSQFEELSRRGAARIDLIEQMARICAISHSWTGRLRWRGYRGNTKACILLSEHIIEDGLTVFAHACPVGVTRSLAPDRPAARGTSAITSQRRGGREGANFKFFFNFGRMQPCSIHSTRITS